MTGKCYVKLNGFQENIQLTWKQLGIDKEFCDITLACGDKEIQANKAVISVYSPMFKNILKLNASQIPFIYLSGVNYEDLEKLLSFMYQGEVNIEEEDLERFLKLADDLQINGLTGWSKRIESKLSASSHENSLSTKQQPIKKKKRKNSDLQNSEIEFPQKQEKEVSHAEYLEELFRKENIDDSAGHKNVKEYSDTNNRNDVEQSLRFDNNFTSLKEVKNESYIKVERTLSESDKKENTCEKCLRIFSGKSHLNRHLKLKKGNCENQSDITEIICEKCLKNFSKKIYLKRHMQLKKGQCEKYMESDTKQIICEVCFKTFGTKAHLKRHKQSIHEGIQYPCHLCDYVATQKGHLHIHDKKYHSEKFIEKK